MTTQDPSAGGDTFPCQNCGAKLHYDAGSQGLRCPYCGHQQAVQAAGPPGQVREIPIEEGYQLAQRGFGTPVKQIACSDCGASVNVGPNEQTAKCAFCGSQQVLAREASGQEIRPESVLPFGIDKGAANTAFEKWLKGLWFRPNDLSRMAKLQEMGGVYVPFWTFDAFVESRWTADAGYYYYETEYYTDQQGNRQSRQVQKTRWQPAWGHRNDVFDDVIVCASKGLPAALVDKFRTFDTKKLVPYQPHYLAGWKAESYAVDLMPAWGTGQQKMADEQRARCARDVPGDTHRNLSVNNTFSRVTFKHVLLPVWIAAYRYSNKPYQFLVNGQTGEVVGKAPWSFWKIFLFSLLIAAIIGVIVYFSQQNQGGGTHSPTPSKPPAAAPTKATPPPTPTKPKK